MGAPKLKAMRQLPLDEADHRQLLDFAKLGLGLDVGPKPTSDKLKVQLRGLGHESVWVADLEIEAPLPVAGAEEDDSAPRTDPETERWVLANIDPEVDVSTGQRVNSTVDMSVNGRTAHLPRGVPVWMGEIFYAHLKHSCVEKKFSQDAASGPDAPPGTRYHFYKPRFNVRFVKYGGVLLENPTPKGWREGERVIGPEGHVPHEVLMSHRSQPDNRIQGI